MVRSSASSHDVVFIGAGINTLVAAAELAGAGWSVAIVEARERIGGFIESAELTLPGFVHDTYSSWHPLFMAGPGYEVLGEALHQHGLEYANTESAVTASVSDAGAVIAHRSPEETANSLESAADRDAYLRMLSDIERWSPHIFGTLGSELSDMSLLRLGAGALRGLRRQGLDDLLRVSMQSGRAFGRERFDGTQVDQLWSPWLLHAGLSPDHASGGLMFPVMAFTMHGLGLPVVVGGAGAFTQAFESLLRARGVDLLLGQEVTGITVDQGRATGVETAAGHLAATRAVVASTSTTDLYTRLLPSASVGPLGRAAAGRHRPGRAAMQIHLALDSALNWRDERLAAVPLVHISDGSSSTGIACAQAEAGLLPNEPTIVVGQQCILDPSRAPQGQATCWIQLQEVPWAPTGDAAGRIETAGTWTTALTQAYVDRVLDRIARFAPGVRESVLGMHVIAPPDLQSANRNALRGDPYGGAADLDQSLLWRPGTGRGHRTEVEALFHIGAFTHPGPGLGGGSGHLVAQQLLKKSPLARMIER